MSHVVIHSLCVSVTAFGRSAAAIRRLIWIRPVPWGARMPAGSFPPQLKSATARFRALALRRHGYYVELFKSGRWTHYFTEQEFIERMRDVIRATELWSQLAEVDSTVVSESTTSEPRRSAA